MFLIECSHMPYEAKLLLGMEVVGHHASWLFQVSGAFAGSSV